MRLRVAWKVERHPDRYRGRTVDVALGRLQRLDRRRRAQAAGVDAIEWLLSRRYGPERAAEIVGGGK